MIRIPRARWTVPFLALGVLAVAGCDDDDDPVGPTEGTLTVIVTSTGEPADADGFTVLLDDEEIGAVNVGANLTEADLATGDYEVELTGIAANCTVAGDNPRTVTINDDATTTTTFAVTCTATEGTVAITTATTGDNLDTEYQVAVGAGAAQAIGPNATLEVMNVAAGETEVTLSDIAANCAVAEDNPTTLTVTGGAVSDATFTVTCALDTGNADVTIATTGANLDPNGYSLVVNDGTPIPIADVNATVLVPSLAAGDNTFRLDDVAANCAVTEGAEQTITVTDQQTADVTYTITCT